MRKHWLASVLDNAQYRVKHAVVFLVVPLLQVGNIITVLAIASVATRSLSETDPAELRRCEIMRGTSLVGGGCAYRPRWPFGAAVLRIPPRERRQMCCLASERWPMGQREVGYNHCSNDPKTVAGHQR